MTSLGGGVAALGAGGAALAGMARLSRPRSKLDQYVEGLGKVIGNLHSLEFMLREFLFERSPDPSFNLEALGVGQTVSDNPMTNYDSLGNLIGKYNQAVPKAARLPKSDLLELRDALAHGRVYALQPDPPFRLVKFSDPKKGPIKVELVEKLDDAWLMEKKKLIHDAIEAVGSGVVSATKIAIK